MINNSQYMKIIQYLSILGGLEPPPFPPGSYAYDIIICVCGEWRFVYSSKYRNVSIVRTHLYTIIMILYIL